MPRVDAKKPEEMSEDVQAIFKEIEGAFGMVPNLFRTYAHHPPLLKANGNKVKAVMMEGTLSPKVKQMHQGIGDKCCQWNWNSGIVASLRLSGRSH